LFFFFKNLCIVSA